MVGANTAELENTHRWEEYHCTAGLQFYKAC